MSNIRNYLEQATVAWPGVESGLYQLLLEHGQEFELKETPGEIEFGTVGECYKNAWLLAFDSDLGGAPGRYVYCEGLAESLIPVLHAWVVDLEDGKAIDPTWTPGMRTRDKPEYFGVIIPDQRWLNRLALERKWCGSVLGAWQQAGYLDQSTAA